jgi:calmodulin
LIKYKYKRSESITENEFKITFGAVDEVERNKQNIKLTQEMEMELIAMFRAADKNNSGFIDRDELSVCLLSIGVNPSQSELDDFMRKFDKNQDSQISIDEFRLIMEEKIKSDVYAMEEMVAEIRKEFIAVDVNNNRVLNREQLR